MALLRLFQSSDLFATLLFGWTAECTTNCLVPSIEGLLGITASWDVTSTLLNISGALLTGLASSALNVAGPQHAALLERLVPCFQGGFIGVWTSFSFMAEHSAEIAWEAPTRLSRLKRGATYVVSSLLGGLACNWLGFRLGHTAALKAAIVRVFASPWLPRAMLAVVVGCVGRAFLSLSGLAIFPRGFVSDPTNPSFLGMKELQSSHRDWKEITVGLGFATLAMWSGDHIGGWPNYGGKPSVLTALLPWQTLRCNAAALAVVVGAFYIKEDRPQLIRNVFFIKCVSSYSGALSAFAGTADETVQLLIARSGSGMALASIGWGIMNLALNGGLAMVASWMLLAHHLRYRQLEYAATKISKLIRQRSARRQLSELQRLHSNKALAEQVTTPSGGGSEEKDGGAEEAAGSPVPHHLKDAVQTKVKAEVLKLQHLEEEETAAEPEPAGDA